MSDVVSSLSGYYGINKPLEFSTSTYWSDNLQLNISNSMFIELGTTINSNIKLSIKDEKFKKIDVSSSLDWTEFKLSDVSLRGNKPNMSSFPSGIKSAAWDSFDELNNSVKGLKLSTLPNDQSSNYSFQLVDLRFDKPNLNVEYRYLPTSDFQIGIELIGFTPDFIQPIDLTKIVSRLSPMNLGLDLPWKKSKVRNIEQELTYGYSNNRFLIGGNVRLDYPIDDDAINPPIEPPTAIEVIKIVNVVNVVKLPERTAIDFVDFTLATDLDSIAWVVNFTIGSQASLDLLKPIGLTTVEVEINVNGELFVCFIGRTKTLISASDKGIAKKSWKCTGWSSIKRLTQPYTNKRSHTETSSSTPAGLLSSELFGTGFTGTWSSPSWTIPANVFSYLEKSPLAAISELAESIGSVIIPHESAKSLIVKPYYPISPWQWATATPDFNMNESQFYSIDTEWIPKEAPDSIYIYGEETGGVAVKAVKAGTAGLVTLPTIVNKYITDTIAGTERGRIEVAKNAFKEIVPVTTFVDATDGIIKPQSLLSITPVSGTTWRGMVIGTSISIKRVGTAIVQALQIERHFD